MRVVNYAAPTLQIEGVSDTCQYQTSTTTYVITFNYFYFLKLLSVSTFKFHCAPIKNLG